MSEEILDDISFQEEPLIDPELEKDLRSYIQRETDYYIDYKKSGKVISSDFVLLLIGVPWIFYRKMYGVIRVIIICSVFLFGVDYLFFAIPLLGIIYTLVLSISNDISDLIFKIPVMLLIMGLCGLLNAKLYLYTAEREIKSLKTKYGYDDLKNQIYQVGGIEIIIPILVVITLSIQFYLRIQECLNA